VLAALIALVARRAPRTRENLLLLACPRYAKLTKRNAAQVSAAAPEDPG
jgi:hypothetical protein